MVPTDVMSAKQIAEMINKTASKAGAEPRELFNALINVTYCHIVSSCHSEGISDDELNRQADETRKLFDRHRIDGDVVADLHTHFERAIGEGHGDIIGDIAALVGALDRKRGQHFTPYSVAEMMSRMTMSKESIAKQISEKGFVSLYDPTCGAGSLILAAFERFVDLGFSRRNFFFEGQDKSALAFKMCAVQLHLKGVPGRVVLGDTLELERNATVYTGAYMRNLADVRLEAMYATMRMIESGFKRNRNKQAA